VSLLLAPTTVSGHSIGANLAGVVADETGAMLQARLSAAQPDGFRGRRAAVVDSGHEGFNLTNHVNFRPPVGLPTGAGASLNTASSPHRTAARDVRQIQWGARGVLRREIVEC